MIEALLVVLVIFEALRFWMNVHDSRRVNATNRRAAELQKLNYERIEILENDLKRMRAAELEEMRTLALTSDTMKEIYEEWVATHEHTSD